jgi:DNA-binding response OmpR family regulator
MATVVIAEDDAALRAAYAHALTRAGYGVIACPTVVAR